MPFTPLHIGPGIAIKAVLQKCFSMVVFSLTQIAIDLEVLWHLGWHEQSLHTFFHTYLGSTVIAILLTFLGKPASQWIKIKWNHIAIKCSDADIAVDIRTTWLASFTGAFIGAYSHVLLDSLFHADIEPFQPWSAANALQGLISPLSLKIMCVILGIAGVVWISMKKRKGADSTKLFGL